MVYEASDHTFVLCAYGESPHLEDAIVSVLDQRVLGSIIVSTSTPNSHIEELCDKYKLELIVNEGESSIAIDWNYGYDAATTPLVTIAHQDDYYERDYLEKILETLNANPGIGVVHTGYYEIRAGAMVHDNQLLRIKKALNRVFSSAMLNGSLQAKRHALRFGDFVCCPSATFDKRVVGRSVFDTQYKNSCDYRTWVNLATRGIHFAYIAEPLMGHRIYAGSTTTATIADGVRSHEDFEIMSELWPGFAAKAIFSLYSKSEKSNSIISKNPAGTGAPATEALAFSASDIVRMGWSFAATKLVYPGARLVRRPISIRGKRGFEYGNGFTCGKNCRIEVFGDGKICLGDNVRIGDNVHIAASELVEIGEESLFASKVYISDTSHGNYGESGSSPDEPPNVRPLVSNPIHIGRNVWLGENVVVLPGVTIGDGCIVGASATVTKSLPAGCIAVGTPAKPIKQYNWETGNWEPL